MDGIGEDLGVADEGFHVVRRIERRSEEADFMNRTGDAAGRDKIAALKGRSTRRSAPPAKLHDPLL